MGIPQILILALYMLSLGVELAKHGETKVMKYDFGGKMLATMIVIGLLIWGGFFK